MRRAAAAALALACAACTTPLETGERRYHAGDHLGALETWRAVPEDAPNYAKTRDRIEVVEAEFQQLVVRYKKRGVYFEEKDRLAESILNYRLALKLQPNDQATLDRVQTLAREVATRKAERQQSYRQAFDGGDLAEARRELDALRTLDPFDPELETEERQFRDALEAEIERQLTLGQRGFAAGNYTAANRSFRKVLELDPENESAQGYISYIATIRHESQRSGEPPTAFKATETFATDAEIRAEGFYQNSLAAERTGDLYAAIRHDLRALRADAGHQEAQRHLAAIRKRLAKEVDTLIESGRTAFRNEDLQSALDLWRDALLIDPENERTQAYIRHVERQLQNLERMRSEPTPAGRGG